MKELFFLLLRHSVLKNTTLDGDTLERIKENADGILAFAKKYDMNGTVALALDELGVCSNAVTRETGLAILRVEKLKAAVSHVSRIFEESKIPHVLLKGSVIRDLYPMPAMRSSCDVDIYVDPKDGEKASLALESKGYEKTGYTIQDINFTSPNGSHIEVHTVLVHRDRLKKASAVLEKVWEHCEAKSEYRHVMDGNMLCFYHLSHMAKHFQKGGCGIKPFLDLALMEQKGMCDVRLDTLVEEGGLVRFRNGCQELTRAWLEGAEHSELSRELETFVLSGETYGTHKNASAAGRHASGNMLCYVLTRAFMPYRQLKNRYPILRDKPILFPFYTVARWLSIFDRRRASLVKKELTVPKDDISSTDTLFTRLGL